MFNSLATSTPAESSSSSVNKEGQNISTRDCAGSRGEAKLAKAVIGQCGADTVPVGPARTCGDD